jgi:hypothetical protein
MPARVFPRFCERSCMPSMRQALRMGGASSGLAEASGGIACGDANVPRERKLRTTADSKGVVCSLKEAGPQVSRQSRRCASDSPYVQDAVPTTESYVFVEDLPIKLPFSATNAGQVGIALELHNSQPRLGLARCRLPNHEYIPSDDALIGCPCRVEIAKSLDSMRKSAGHRNRLVFQYKTKLRRPAFIRGIAQDRPVAQDGIHCVHVQVRMSATPVRRLEHKWGTIPRILTITNPEFRTLGVLRTRALASYRELHAGRPYEGAQDHSARYTQVFLLVELFQEPRRIVQRPVKTDNAWRHHAAGRMVPRRPMSRDRMAALVNHEVPD